MDRINHSSAETDKHGAGKDGWTNGDPADEASGTVPQAAWFDGVQEELVTIIEAAGLTPSNGDYTQLAASILSKATGTYIADANLLFSGITGDQTARVSDFTNPTNDKFLALSFGPTAQRINIYYSDGGGSNNSIEIASNCYWNQGTGWVSSGVNEGLLTLGKFADGSRGPSLTIENTLVSNDFTQSFTIYGDVAAPASGPLANSLYPAAVSKVEADITVTGGTESWSTKSFGVSDVTAITSYVAVDFNNAFANTDYMVQVSSAGTDGKYYQAAKETASQVRVYCKDLSGNVDCTLGTLRFCLSASGEQ